MKIPWGDESLELKLPDSWRVLGEFTPGETEVASSTFEAVVEALDEPIGSVPLEKRDLSGKRILLISDDATRPTPVHEFIGEVCSRLHKAGASDENIEVLFALGVHKAMTQEQAIAKVGAEIIKRHRWHNHDAFSEENLVELGTTSNGTNIKLNRMLKDFDLLIFLGTVEPHPLAGFSGGCKMLLPGCAGAETIGANHMKAALTGDGVNVGRMPDFHKMRIDMEEAADLLGREIFAVNVALNSDGKVLRAFCGDPAKAFRAGIAFNSLASEIIPSEAADIVVVNSHPFDSDLRQGLKVIANVIHAARKGGTIIALLKCNNGLGEVLLPGWMPPNPVLRFIVKALGAALPYVATFAMRCRAVEEKFMGQLGVRMLKRNWLYVYAPNLPADTGRRMGIFRQYENLDELIAEVEKKSSNDATVSVFPSGGCVYCRQVGE